MKHVITAATLALVLGLTVPALADHHESKSMDQQQLSAQMNQNQGERVVVGKVVEARDIKLKTVAGDGHRLVKIENAEGKRMIVDLGLTESVNEMGIDLQQGDTILAVGKSARINQRPVLYAKYVGQLYQVGNQGQGQ